MHLIYRDADRSSRNKPQFQQYPWLTQCPLHEEPERHLYHHQSLPQPLQRLFAGASQGYVYPMVKIGPLPVKIKNNQLLFSRQVSHHLQATQRCSKAIYIQTKMNYSYYSRGVNGQLRNIILMNIINTTAHFQ